MDIILLIFLCTRIARLAEEKKISKTRWILITVFYWILGEAFGVLLLLSLLISLGRVDPETIQPLGEATKEMVFIMCTGYLGGYLGYLFTRKRIEDLPDSNDTTIR
ncbi:MAG TPA: hypothetical protein VK796_13190 [Cytophaga sp.]|jgi:hypothetical protein|nr:hypothetical protein [Cytophaga sp.]